MSNPRPVKTPSRIRVRIDAAGITAVSAKITTQTHDSASLA